MQDPAISVPGRWPTTVEAAVKQLLTMLSEESKATVRELPEEELIHCHYGLGMAIRNEFGLWKGNEKLLKAACPAGGHPDDASMVIIQALWQALHDKRLLH
ncbi:hypothetical protein JQR84_24075 (plasmid) [Pseudomonas luteola]|uniref:DUF6794 domain-containing protein n=1 Tax=Pseudomonas TaxID=286 RepID=UPI003DA12A9C